MAGIVVTFISEAHGDAVLVKGPELFDQTVIQLSRPFALKKSDDRRSASQELRAISPARVDCVGERDFLGVTRVPRIFRKTNF